MSHTFTAVVVVPRPCLTHASIAAALVCLFTPTAAAILGLNHLMTRRCELDTLLLDTPKLSYSKRKITEGQVPLLKCSYYKVESRIFIVCLNEVIPIAHILTPMWQWISPSAVSGVCWCRAGAQQMCLEVMTVSCFFLLFLNFPLFSFIFKSF